VGVEITKPRLTNEFPLNISYGIEVGNHKIPGEKCATMHELRAAVYLYTLPVSGPRSLVATGAGVGYCPVCDRLLNVETAVVPPGIYQAVADVYVDSASIPMSIAGYRFLYDGTQFYKL
jgi:hypothetical protein